MYLEVWNEWNLCVFFTEKSTLENYEIVWASNLTSLADERRERVESKVGEFRGDGGGKQHENEIFIKWQSECGCEWVWCCWPGEWSWFSGGLFCQRAAQPSHSSSKLARCGKMGIFAVHRVGIWAAVKLTENILLMNFYFLMMTSATPCNSALFSMFKCVFFQLEHLYDDYDDDDIAWKSCSLIYLHKFIFHSRTRKILRTFVSSSARRAVDVKYCVRMLNIWNLREAQNFAFSPLLIELSSSSPPHLIHSFRFSCFVV